MGFKEVLVIDSIQKTQFSPYFARISHGTKAHPPRIAHRICPRRILINLGNNTVISLAAESEFAEMLVPSVASTNEKEAKKAAARLSQWSMRVSGFQRTEPYSTIPADVTAMPMKPTRVKAAGITRS